MTRAPVSEKKATWHAGTGIYPRRWSRNVNSIVRTRGNCSGSKGMFACYLREILS